MVFKENMVSDLKPGNWKWYGFQTVLISDILELLINEKQFKKTLVRQKLVEIWTLKSRVKANWNFELLIYSEHLRTGRKNVRLLNVRLSSV